MQQVVVVGCGVIGAMIAYELSHCPNLQVTVLDRQPPAQDSTGAALGVLMGIISQKVSGRAWAMRQVSIRRYATLLPELAAATGTALTWNQQGIVKLCFADDDLERWQQIIQQRHDQGWQLECWSVDQVRQRCPQVQAPGLTAAIYSPQDYQVDPTALTLTLVEAAQQRQVQFRFDAAVEKLSRSDRTGACHSVQTATDDIAADWVVIAAGLGSTALMQTAQQPISIRPVLGQAMRIRLDQPLGNPAFQPVITGHDIHLVPLNNQEFWVGATVEFPGEIMGEATGQPLDLGIEPVAERLQAVWQGAVSLWPALAGATRLKTWSGLRPRPERRPAPIVEPLAGYPNVWVATGHYRNGVLLAPATAQLIREALTAS